MSWGPADLDEMEREKVREQRVRGREGGREEERLRDGWSTVLLRQREGGVHDKGMKNLPLNVIISNHL